MSLPCALLRVACFLIVTMVYGANAEIGFQRPASFVARRESKDHEMWTCTGCSTDEKAEAVFDRIRVAAQHADRLSYLALDMNWLDRLLAVEAKVHVTYLDFAYMKAETMPGWLYSVGKESSTSAVIREKSSGTTDEKAKDRQRRILTERQKIHAYHRKLDEEEKDKSDGGPAKKLARADIEETGKEDADEKTSGEQTSERSGDSKEEHRENDRPNNSNSELDSKRSSKDEKDRDEKARGDGDKREKKEDTDKREDVNTNSKSSSSTTSSSSSHGSSGNSIVKTAEDDRASEEVFKVVAFHFDNTPKVSKRQYQTAADNFLALNPCWIPLYEPAVPISDVMSRTQASSKVGAAATTPVVLFAKLPDYGFKGTCRMYEALIRRQFPAECAYKPTRMMTFHLGNIGYGNVLSFLMHAFASGLQASNFRKLKVFTAPIAHKFLGRTSFTSLIGSDAEIGQKEVNISKIPQGLWAWADPLQCDTTVFLNNPWACNFISFTNCSSRVKSSTITPVDLLPWDRVTRFLRANTTVNGAGNVTDVFRKEYNDAPYLTDDDWARSRLYAFFERPNAQLRVYLRQSLRNIKPTREVVSSLVPSPLVKSIAPLRMPPPPRSAEVVEKEKQKEKEEVQKEHGVSVLPRCMVMHVRHNDVSADRNVTAIDRSLAGHVQLALELQKRNGADYVFLATDNASIVERVATEYPQFHWYTQLRPLSKTSTLFQMFTDPYQGFYNDMSIHTIKGHDYVLKPSTVSSNSGASSGISSSGAVPDEKPLDSLGLPAGHTYTYEVESGDESGHRRKRRRLNFIDQFSNVLSGSGTGAGAGTGGGTAPKKPALGGAPRTTTKSAEEMDSDALANAVARAGAMKLQPYSVMRDLAHIITDIRYASICNTAVGASDSGFTLLLDSHMCAMRTKGCPVFLDVTSSKEERMKKLDMLEIDVHEKLPGKNVVSFGVNSTSLQYYGGAMRNFDFCGVYYPGWTCRFYVDKYFDVTLREQILRKGGEVVPCPVVDGVEMDPLFARLLVASDAIVDRFIIRDTDARISSREWFAVHDWVDSSRKFHIMRDHPTHCVVPMLGGMWGAVRGAVPDMEQLVSQWYTSHKGNKIALSTNEAFLRDRIWPLIEKDTSALLTHDSYCCERWTPDEKVTKPFPRERLNHAHVGQTFLDPDTDDPIQDVELLKQKEAPMKCRKKPTWTWG